MKKWFLCAASVLLIGCGGESEQTGPTADMVVLEAELVTLAEPAEAMAIREGRIVATGTSAEIEAMIGPETEVLRLTGRTVVPGFIEGHGHLLGIGHAKMNLELMGVPTWDDIIAMVEEAAAEAEPGSWILGRGWHQEKFTPMPEVTIEGYPVHDALSAVTPDHPVLLTHASGHALFANARAMAMAGIDDETPDPAGGKIVRDPRGRAIGVFEENAESLIRRVHAEAEAELTEAQREAREDRALELAVAECLAKGITSFQDAGSSFADVARYKRFADEDRLGIRLWVMLNESNEALREDGGAARVTGYADNRLTVGGIKRYADGALGARGAWLLEEYSDLPGHFGQKVSDLAYIEETARIALEQGYQLCTHAIGDRGNREVLDIYERVLDGAKKRWRIEHAQHLHPEDIPRFAELDVIASMQHVHCTSDAPFVVPRLGEERARTGAYVWRALRASGAIVTNGTDAPVEDVDPLPSFYATVTRQPAEGEPFYPQQTLEPVVALETYTIACAEAAFEEDLKGTLEVGKLADFVVLDRNITEVPAEQILDTRVLMTVVGGVARYRAQ